VNTTFHQTAMSDIPSNVDAGRRTSARQKDNKAQQQQQKLASSSSSTSVPTISNSKRKSNDSTNSRADDDSQEIRTKKSVRKQTTKSPNEISSKFYCNGCNIHFPDFTTVKHFVRMHHMQVQGVCLASCFICSLVSCKSAHYNHKGFMAHIASCPQGRKIYNTGKLTENRVSAMNSTQMTLSTVAPGVGRGWLEREVVVDKGHDYARYKTNQTPNQRNVVEAFLLANPHTIHHEQGAPPDLEERDSPSSTFNNKTLKRNVEVRSSINEDNSGVDNGQEKEYQDTNEFDGSPNSCSFAIESEFSTNPGPHSFNEFVANHEGTTAFVDEPISDQETEYANSLLKMKEEMKNNIDKASKDIHFLMAIELEIILWKAGAPLYLFDDIMKWGLRNRDSFP